MFSWYRGSSTVERRTFWACLAGWTLDALDVQLFSLAIPVLIAAWGLSNAEAGLIGSATLIASALGGWLAGFACDRYGCVKVLKNTVLWYSGFTFLCAFSGSYSHLIVLKALQGFGFGGEWTAGAVLMSQVIRPEFRGRAVGAVQSGWAIGWGLAVLLYTVAFSFIPAATAWRVMFALGILPALLVVFIRRGLPPDVDRSNAGSSVPLEPFTAIFERRMLRVTLAGALLGIGASGGYYSVMTWLPTFLKVERHLSVTGTGGYLAIIIVAYWLGCMAAAWLLDAIGRRPTVMLFSVLSTVMVIAYLVIPMSNSLMLVLGFPLGFLASGVPASMGALFSELFPSGMRGTGVGFCYNAGRVISAGFPALVGQLSKVIGLGTSIAVYATVAYALVILSILMLPETKGLSLNAVTAGEPNDDAYPLNGTASRR